MRITIQVLGCIIQVQWYLRQNKSKIKVAKQLNREKSRPSKQVCTTLLAVSGILQTHPGRRGSWPGRWTGRDPVTCRPRPRMRALASARRCCHSHRAGPLVRPGALPTALASQVLAGLSPAATGPGPLRCRNGAHCAHSPTG